MADVAAPLGAAVIAVGERLRDKAVPDLCFDPVSPSPCSGSTAIPAPRLAFAQERTIGFDEAHSG